jgi:hypothetical protein
MNDDRREGMVAVPGDELLEVVPLAPKVPSLPDADRKRLEALLRDLLRDDSLRGLLCKEDA